MLFNDPTCRSFVAKRPIAVMSQLALGRMLDAETINQLFLDTTQRQ